MVAWAGQNYESGRYAVAAFEHSGEMRFIQKKLGFS